LTLPKRRKANDSKQPKAQSLDLLSQLSMMVESPPRFREEVKEPKRTIPRTNMPAKQTQAEVTLLLSRLDSFDGILSERVLVSTFDATDLRRLIQFSGAQIRKGEQQKAKMARTVMSIIRDGKLVDVLPKPFQCEAPAEEQMDEDVEGEDGGEREKVIECEDDCWGEAEEAVVHDEDQSQWPATGPGGDAHDASGQWGTNRDTSEWGGDDDNASQWGGANDDNASHDNASQWGGANDDNASQWGGANDDNASQWGGANDDNASQWGGANDDNASQWGGASQEGDAVESQWGNNDEAGGSQWSSTDAADAADAAESRWGDGNGDAGSQWGDDIISGGATTMAEVRT
jgi:hypothetical protein